MIDDKNLRTVESKSGSNLKIPVLLQPPQFLLSLIFIIVFKNWGFFTDADTHPSRLHQVASGGFANIILCIGCASLFFTFIDWKCKIGKEETTQEEQVEKDKASNENEKKLKEEAPKENNDTAVVQTDFYLTI